MTAKGVPIVVAPAYAMTPLGRRHAPPRLKSGDYDQYRECLRLDFQYRCAYCLAYESEVAPADKWALFEIEHFRPQGVRRFRRFRLMYANLLWACHACNRAKRETWPDADQVKRGERFVDPSTEALGGFLTINGALVDPNPAEPAAQYMIDEINLNSDVHQQRREQRSLKLVRIATLESVLQVLRQRLGNPPDPQILDAIAKEEAELKSLCDALGAAPPWDAPEWCHCDS